MDNKFLIAGVFFVFIGISGYGLSHAGKPIHVVLLTVHKLISLAALAYLVVIALSYPPGGAARPGLRSLQARFPLYYLLG